MKHVSALFLLLALAACAASIRPMGQAVEQPRLAGDFLIAADGAKLPLKRWLPAGGKQPRAVIVALHGFNDYANAFALPAPFWAGNGIATYAYDQRGFGGAPNRGYWAGTRSLTADLRGAIRAVRARHPGLPVYAVGVSMGGAVVMAALGDGRIPGLSGAVLVAPAVWGREHMTVIQSAALWLSYSTVPGLALSAEGLELQPSDNIPMLRELARDPMIIRETRIDAIKGLVDLMDDAYEAAPNIGHTATYMVYGLRDEIVPKAATFETMRTLKKTSRRARFGLYESGWHMLLRDLDATTLWRDIAAWIRDPAAKLPSLAEEKAEKLLKDDRGVPPYDRSPWDREP